MLFIGYSLKKLEFPNGEDFFSLPLNFAFVAENHIAAKANTDIFISSRFGRETKIRNKRTSKSTNFSLEGCERFD